MRILHVDLGKEMRGGQYQVLLLMQGLAARGHQQALVARRKSPLMKEARARGWKAGTAFPPGPWDVIHAHDAQAHTRIVLRGAKTPLVVSRRVAFPVRQGFFSRLKYRRTAHYLAVSEFVKQQLLAAGIADQKISVVFDGVTLPNLDHAAELRARYRRENRWDGFVAGALPTPAEKPRHLLKGIPIAKETDVTPFLFALDAFVYVSESEGLGSGILLALAHGLPVIASNVGGIPEIVRDGETGLLIRNTAEDLAGALARLAGDAALRQRLGAAGRAWVAGHATDAIMAAQTEAVYSQVLGSQR